MEMRAQDHRMVRSRAVVWKCLLARYQLALVSPWILAVTRAQRFRSVYRWIQTNRRLWHDIHRNVTARDLLIPSNLKPESPAFFSRADAVFNVDTQLRSGQVALVARANIGLTADNSWHRVMTC